jgi:hypothetical protein
VLATPASATGQCQDDAQDATPQLFTGVGFGAAQHATPGLSLSDMLKSPADQPSPPGMGGCIPGLTPISASAPFGTPVSATAAADACELEAPATEPVLSFFASPAPAPGSGSGSEQAWLPAEQAAFAPTPLAAAAMPDAAASPFVTVRVKTPAPQRATPASQPQQAHAAQEAQPEQPVASVDSAAGKASGKPAKSVAFNTPATAGAAAMGRSPLMSQLSGAGHTPWAKSQAHSTPAAGASAARPAVPPVPKFSAPAAVGHERHRLARCCASRGWAASAEWQLDGRRAAGARRALHPCGSRPAPRPEPLQSAPPQAAAKPEAAAAGRASSATPAAGSWSFLKPTASSQAKAAAAPAASAAPAAAAVAAAEPRVKSVVVFPEASSADPRWVQGRRLVAPPPVGRAPAHAPPWLCWPRAGARPRRLVLRLACCALP